MKKRLLAGLLSLSITFSGIMPARAAELMIEESAAEEEAGIVEVQDPMENGNLDYHTDEFAGNQNEVSGVVDSPVEEDAENLEADPEALISDGLSGEELEVGELIPEQESSDNIDELIGSIDSPAPAVGETFEETTTDEEFADENLALESILTEEVDPDENIDLAGAGSGTCGANLTWTLDSKGTTLTISGSGAMDDYKSDDEVPWHESASSIKNVVIEDGVTSIGNKAFYFFFNMTSVTIPESVTYIGDSAFWHCQGLTSISIPNNVTNIGNSAFGGCTGLSGIRIPSGVTNIGDKAFYGCSNLQYITVADNNEYYSSKDGVLFNKAKTDLICCPVGKTGDYQIPDSVTNIWEEAFNYCKKLNSITIPGSVTSIGDKAFSTCTGLISLTVAESNVYYSSQDGVLFNKQKTELLCCPGGKVGDYNIPNGVESIGRGAFEYCEELTGISLPDSVTNIGDYAFSNCWSIESIIIPDRVVSIGNHAFDGCDRLIGIIIPDSVVTIGDSAFNRCTGIASVTIGKGTTSIGDSAFANCYNLTSIIIPYNVTTIGYKTFSGARLTSITLPAGVTRIADGAFESCYSLSDVYYAGSEEDWGTISIADDNYPLFSATIHYNAGDYEDPSDSTVASGACGDNLTWALDDQGVLTISGSGEMWNYSLDGSGLLPPWNEEGWYSSIKEVVIGNEVASIGSYAFCDCSGLERVTIPESVIDIGEYAFYNCMSLTSVTLPTNIQEIKPGSFAECQALESVTVPGGVMFIGYQAFNGCIQLKDVYYNGTEEEWNSIPIEYENDPLITAKKHCMQIVSIELSASQLTANTNKEINLTGTLKGTDAPEISKLLFQITQTDGNVANVNIKPASIEKEEDGAYTFSQAVTFREAGEYDIKVSYEDSFCEGKAYVLEKVKGLKNTSDDDIRAERGISIIWDESYGDLYQIQSSKDADFSEVVDDYITDEEEYAVESLERFTLYYFRVRNVLNQEIAFYGEWSDSIKILSSNTMLLTDTWNFENPTSKIPVGIYRMFFEEASAKFLQREDNGTRGHCAGMVLSASSSFVGYPGWGEGVTLNEVDKNDFNNDLGCTAIDFVDYAYTYQNVPSFQDGLDYSMDNLRDAVSAFQTNAGNPVFIGMQYEKGGHAVLGYRITEETNDHTKIAVYDCNRPNQKCYVILNGRKGNYTGWKYKGSLNWSSDLPNSKICYADQTIQFVSDYDSKYASDYTLLKTKKNLLGSIILGINPPIGLIMLLDYDLQDVIPIKRFNGIGKDVYNEFWIKNDGPVTFTDLSGEGDISLAGGQLEMTVDPADGCDLTIDLSKGEAVFTNCENDNISIKYELSSDYENSTVTTITGISNGDSKTIQDAEGNIIFTGLENCNITLDANIENVDGTTTATSLDGRKLSGLDPSKEYIVYEIDKKELEIYEDKDENGSFETPVTERKLFSDVTNPNDFFYEPIYWAVDNGITTGYKDNTFRPYNNCNRAAVVTFLWRLAGKPDMGITNAFSDMTGNEDFDHAITWAAAEGITTGYKDGTFRPWDTCHRAAIVTFLWRYAGKPEPTSMASFTDMTGNDDFNKAISWAAEKGITNGYDDGTFRPWNQCLRLAVASFLYRYAHL